MQLPQSWTTVTWLSKTLAILLFVSLPFGGYYLGNKNVPKINCPLNEKENKKEIVKDSWVKPASIDSGFPIVKDKMLYWYSTTKKELYPTKYQTSCGSGAKEYGEDNPLPSPDGKYIAFINKGDDQKLYILPVGSKEAIKITNYPVDYLNSWSTDSSKILYHSFGDNLETSKEPEPMAFRPAWETNVTFNKDTVPGFHSFDINNGRDTFLSPLQTAEKFIDRNRILVEMKENENNNIRYVLFNVDTFLADFSTVNYPIISFGRQTSFSADAAFWVKTVDDGQTNNGVKIIYSSFPNNEGTMVESGPWAFIQRPLLNSSGKVLAYTKRDDKIEQGQFAGQYRDKTVIWDTDTKNTIAILDGFPEYWINENSLLIGKAEYGSNPDLFTSMVIYNVKTKTSDMVNIK